MPSQRLELQSIVLTKLLQNANPEEGVRLGLRFDFRDRACDFCETSLSSAGAFVDGSLTWCFQWAYMCPACFLAAGKGLGHGRGQLYQLQEPGKWLMVAGFPPEEQVSPC